MSADVLGGSMPDSIRIAIDDYGIVCANVVKRRTTPEMENMARGKLEQAIRDALAPNVGVSPQQVEAAARERDVDRKWCLLKAEEHRERAERIDSIIAERFTRLAALCATGGRGGAERAEALNSIEPLDESCLFSDYEVVQITQSIASESYLVGKPYQRLREKLDIVVAFARECNAALRKTEGA